MFILRKNFNYLIVLIFLASCSSMNVTEEKVYSDNVKTVEALTSNIENINYETKAVFASATIYFEFDRSNLTSKSIQTLKSAVNVLFMLYPPHVNYLVCPEKHINRRWLECTLRKISAT